MGADVHITAEYIGTSDFIWRPNAMVPWQAPMELWRDYFLFGLMAQVRRPHEQGFAPRGLPKNVSKETLSWIDDSDYHSHSYLSFDEAWFVADIARNKQFSGLLLYVEQTWVSRDNQRLVFAFDN